MREDARNDGRSQQLDHGVDQGEETEAEEVFFDGEDDEEERNEDDPRGNNNQVARGEEDDDSYDELFDDSDDEEERNEDDPRGNNQVARGDEDDDSYDELFDDDDDDAAARAAAEAARAAAEAARAAAAAAAFNAAATANDPATRARDAEWERLYDGPWVVPPPAAMLASIPRFWRFRRDPYDSADDPEPEPETGYDTDDSFFAKEWIGADREEKKRLHVGRAKYHAMSDVLKSSKPLGMILVGYKGLKPEYEDLDKWIEEYQRQG